jgi:hypothetical protein
LLHVGLTVANLVPRFGSRLRARWAEFALTALGAVCGAWRAPEGSPEVNGVGLEGAGVLLQSLTRARGIGRVGRIDEVERFFAVIVPALRLELEVEGGRWVAWALYWWFKKNRALDFAGVPRELFGVLGHLVASSIAELQSIAAFCFACLWMTHDDFVLIDLARDFPGQAIGDAAGSVDTALCCLGNFVAARGCYFGALTPVLGLARRILTEGVFELKRYAAAMIGLAATMEPGSLDEESEELVRELMASLPDADVLELRGQLDETRAFLAASRLRPS